MPEVSIARQTAAERIPSPIRVAADLSILRHGQSGSARWATGLTDALSLVANIELRGWRGPQRHGWRGPMRRFVNAARERIYYELSLPRAAGAWGADVMLMPVNVTARRSSVPQVVTIHDVNFLAEPETYDPWFRAYASRMFARAGRDAELVTTVSAYSRERICEYLSIDPGRVRVVYPGLSPPRPTSGPAPIPDRYALYVGATEPHKNVGLLLDVWAGPRRPPLRLVVVGTPGRAHEAVVRQAEEIGDRVLIVGEVDEPTLERWYAGAEVFLFPSLAEGFGYPPLEAMQRGVPVIASRASSLPEVLGEAALYHGPRDPDQLAAQLDALLAAPELRARIVEAGLAQAARYRWDATALKMADLLWQVAGQSRGAGEKPA
jgi:glycosyltransferase involved in cell wall biosynthesis